METLEIIRHDIGLSQSLESFKLGLIYSYLYQTISTKELAKKMEVPVPIATAFKKELVKHGWMQRASFYTLTEVSRNYVLEELHYKNVDKDQYLQILTDETSQVLFLESMKIKLTDIYAKRPVAKRELDQAHATIETVLKRVALLLNDPLIFAKEIAFVGDDDLVSIFLAHSLASLGFESKSNLSVYDIDADLLLYISENQPEQVEIKVYQQDFKEEIQEIDNQVDIVFTDPPYTSEGILTFIDTGANLLRNQGKMYASFNNKTPAFQSFIQQEIAKKDFNFVEIIPKFNHYLGGSIIGNVSHLYVLQKNNMAQTSLATESIYTYHLKRNKMSQRLGFHTLYDLRGCNQDLLTDVESVTEKLTMLSKQFKLNVVTENFHQFMPYGVSGVMVLKESHFTIHTWPEYGYAAVDLFVCEDTVDEQAFMNELQNAFESTMCEVKKIFRES
ncbi:adenosylmethionine decarboxylase [Vagococcus silagei]|uniref:S-adenosylmethionine decarboxylase proenzyme n=1 Tax=Vagococcus silagei TaxID=2508885 RepID=A0A4S3B4M0_9ENTE|nr:adenosylmethionine decarboxylase [Vagococcus silagei]THB60356.1 adenosylmethionine decarboxylase [Vagococcus silagei]